MKLTHPQLVQIHTEALAIEERIAAQLDLSLSPRGACERTRDPAYRRARVVVRQHADLWVEWTRAERLRWQIAMTAERILYATVRILPACDREDVCAAALPYLFTAAVTWDPALGKFSTHARHWIRAGVTRQSSRHAAAATVRLTATGQRARRHAGSADIARFRFRRDTYDAARGWAIGSLDGNTDGDRPSEDVRDDRPSAEERLVEHDRAVWLHDHLDAVARVLPRHVEAARLYHGFDGEDRTLSDVGAQLGGLSRERARQLQRGAIAAIRHRIGLEPGEATSGVMQRLALIPVRREARL